MTRKVTGTAHLRLLLPIEIEVEYEIHSDEGANIENVMKRQLKGLSHSLGDLNRLELTKILSINGDSLDDDDRTDLGEAVTSRINDLLEATPAQKLELVKDSMTVEDSR